MTRALLLLAFGVSACADAPVGPAPALRAPSDPAPVTAPDSIDVRGLTGATATLDPVGGSGVSGRVELQSQGDALRVLARVDRLPADRHVAFQVLLGRDCDADPDVHLGAERGLPHGSPYRPPSQRHDGDLGNIRGDDSRTGRYDRIDTVLSLDGPSSAAGRAVVLRENRDDATTAPAGRAGDVIACGVFSGGPS